LETRIRSGTYVQKCTYGLGATPRRTLPWRLQLALDPALGLIRFQRVRAVAFKALERARAFAAGRQRQDQLRPAIGASRSLGLAHAIILPPVQNLVNSNTATVDILRAIKVENAW
jgi:hypothetical protein